MKTIENLYLNNQSSFTKAFKLIRKKFVVMMIDAIVNMYHPSSLYFILNLNFKDIKIN